MLTIRGSFTTQFGTLAIEQEGASVTGAYPHEDGRIEGSLDGRTLTGRWVQSPPNKRGPMELWFDEHGNAFQGHWRFDGDADWRGRWDGARLELPAPGEGGSPGSWNSRSDGPLLSGPLVGEVGEGDVRIWLQARAPEEITLTVHGPDGASTSRTVTPTWDAWLCATLTVDGLAAGTEYDYELTSASGISPAYRFRTAPPSSARKATIVLGSCFWDWPNPSLGIFDAIGDDDPDLLVLLGDNAYYDDADVRTENTMMLAQLRHRNNATFRKLAAVTPTIAVWDDHDFGPNDTDGRFPGKGMAFRAFQRMWANRQYGAPGVPGLFSRVRCGPVEVFLLDERYHRGVAGQEVLGKGQLDWLLHALQKSQAPVKLIASPSQVLPHYPVKKGYDCFRKDGPGELDALIGALDGHDIRGVVFVSGDLHMANLMHVGGRFAANGKRRTDLWELTTSPLANAPWNEAAGDDPTLVREVIDRTNYGLCDVDLDRAGAEIRLVLKDEEGGTLFEQPISLADLRAR